MGKKGQGGREFEFCGVCRMNHNDGRQHVYFPRHKRALSDLLSRFLSKFSEVRFFLRNPSFLRCDDAGRNRFWCAVCEEDVDEVDSEFACCNAINHLAGSEHLVSLKSFLWKHGAGQDRVDKFRVSEEEFSKWENRCRSMKMGQSSSNASNIGPSNNIHNGISCLDRKSYENDSEHRLEIGATVPSGSGSLAPPNNILNGANSLDMLTFQKPVNHSFESGNLCDGVLPLQRFTHESYQIRYQMGRDGTDGFGSAGQQMIAYMNSQRNREGLGFSSEKMVNKMNGGNDGGLELYSVYGVKQGVVDGNSDFMALENLTRLPCVPGDQMLNVHSGAPPPWLRTNEDIQTTCNPRETGGNTTRSSKTVRSQKRRKPERVGAAWAERRKAELEKEKRGEVVNSHLEADWLPNFGRVWQSGSRKESRREFENERRKVLKTENVSSDAPVMSFKLQPYISKRMRQDAESCGVSTTD
ncbi:TITAN-like protein isoform X2 [Nymphaea colorata]|uniref:TITAN-like protein isoform X2 n=1 Tax=Nymphaea colorata TaxID=210225 RepID=UPI00129E0CC4|nr:TITAN-like protein isoform X2 [Nymphaea colorata]